MRGVVKATSSASSSPRSSMLGRRKTIMSDAYRRRPVMMEHDLMATETYGTHDGLQAPPLRTTRPVSWHPSTQMAPQPSYQSYPMPEMNNFELPPTPAVYSGYTSPSSTFSPLSQPFTEFQRQQQFQYLDETSFFPTASYDTSSNIYAPYQPSTLRQETEIQPFLADTGGMDPAMYSHFDWNNFASNGFSSATAPPTPENFLPIQHPSPSFEVSEPPPYTLDDPDSDDEPLVGLGLYDTPEKSPAYDPHFDNYRAQMMAKLLGPSYRKYEPTGKGLKLEETWNPPPSDDGDDDGEADSPSSPTPSDEGDENNDNDCDAEAEDGDENIELSETQGIAQESMTFNQRRGITDIMGNLDYKQHFNQSTGWL